MRRLCLVLVMLGLIIGALPWPRVSAAPVISGVVRVDTCDTSVLINFNTSVPARAYIDYGVTESYGSATIDDTVRFYTEHVIPITGLTANTPYNFRVTAIGDGTTQTGNLTFTTAASGSACRAQPVQVDTRMPDMTGATEKRVCSTDPCLFGGARDYTLAQFQTALNDAATAGQKRYITVESGQTLTNQWVLPAKSGTNWVIIRPSNHASLPEGKRVTPSDAANMFRITNTTVDAPLVTSGVSSYWRMIGAEVTIEDSALADADSAQGGLILPGNDTTSEASQPHHLIFDRMYVHGIPNRSTMRGFYLRAGADIGIIDSYISEIHSTGQDSQAILAVANQRVKIVNNWVEGAGENFMWGGTGLCCPNYTVGDLTYTHNYMAWPIEWKMNHASFGTFTITGVNTSTDTFTAVNHKLPANKWIRVTSTGTLPAPLQSATTTTDYFVRNPTANTFQLSTTSGGSVIDITTTGSGTIKGGIDYVKKNLFELKTSRRVLIYGNIFERMWGPDQDTAINLKLELNSCRGFTIDTGTDRLSDTHTPPAVAGQEIQVRNSGGTLPTPLSTATTYYACNVSGTTFQLSTASNCSSIVDITSTGTGTQVYRFAADYFEDVTFYKNIIRNTALGFVIINPGNGNECLSILRVAGENYSKRLLIAGNLVELDADTWNNDDDGSGYGQGARAMSLGGPGTGTLAQGPDAVKVDHNTFINAHPPANADDSDAGTGSMALLLDPNATSGNKGVNFIFTNNIMGNREFGVRLGEEDPGGATANLDLVYTGYVWNRNMIVKNETASGYPDSCTVCVSNWTNAKFVNFNAGRGGNYRLASDSPGKNAGTDTLDVGADVAALERATESTIDGNWPTTGSGITVCKWGTTPPCITQ